jgi:hypothetical protein
MPKLQILRQASTSSITPRVLCVLRKKATAETSRAKRALTMAQVMAREVHTQMPYLARHEIFDREKPFGADFPVDHFQGGQLANHIYDNQAITVHDIRRGKPPALDLNGFCFIRAPTSLRAAEATNLRSPPVEKYLGEIERILYEAFPEYSRIEIMDFQVCCWTQDEENPLTKRIRFGKGRPSFLTQLGPRSSSSSQQQCRIQTFPSPEPSCGWRRPSPARRSITKIKALTCSSR